MYIRAVVTTNRDTGHKYTTHRLVESYQTENGPRQRPVMHLGTLELPKEQWRELARVLEGHLAGKPVLPGVVAAEVLEASQVLLGTVPVQADRRRKRSANKDALEKCIPVKLADTETEQSRSLGPELVAHGFWQRLGFAELLGECGLTEGEVTAACVSIVGRLVAPGSERATQKWFELRSCLGELLGKASETVGKNSLYEVGEALLERKEEIESKLYLRQRALYPSAQTLFLYDLTNTYFEGRAEGNPLALRGKSKEKRADCPLVTLALLVDHRGMPVFSHIYAGNQSEPVTLADVLARLEGSTSQLAFSQVAEKATLVMDRGIATKDNIDLLKAKGHPYIVVERRATEKDYRCDFETAPESFEVIENASSKDDTVYVKRIEAEEGSRVLCLSLKRRGKEQAMDALKQQRLVDALSALAKSVEKGTVSARDKVIERIGRLKERFSSVARYYDIAAAQSSDGRKVTSVSWSLKQSKQERETLTGCYVIQSSYTDLTATQLWRSYMTLTRVEQAFSDLKSDLGVRPIFHQREERVSGHLFIAVLAYHMLAAIELELKAADIRSRWATVRDDLSTHQRTTVILTDSKGVEHRVRTSSRVETHQQAYYDALHITNPLAKRKLDGRSHL